MTTAGCALRTVVRSSTRRAPATRQRPGAGRLVGVDMDERTCRIGVCTNTVRALGMCKNHYEQQRRRSAAPVRKRAPRVDDMSRFMQKTRELPNGCLEWTAALDQGYGVFSIPQTDKPSVFTTIRAHRWLWQQEHGPLPGHIDLDHYRWPQDGCIGRSCVRHVRPASRQENLLRGDTVPSALLARTHCRNGHPFTPENTYTRTDGYRTCRTCTLVNNKKWRDRRSGG